MTRKLPWMQFSPDRWLKEPRLKWCDRRARSLWQDMLCLMHDANPRGHLIVDGVVQDAAKLAALLGDKPEDVAAWLAELEANGVFSRTPEGIIYSRGMVRDTAKMAEDRAAGRKGGSPTHRGADIAPLDAAADAANRRIKAAARAKRARDKKRAAAAGVTQNVTPEKRDASVTRNVTERDASRCDERDAGKVTSCAPRDAAASRVTRHGVHPKRIESKREDSSLVTAGRSPRPAARPSHPEGRPGGGAIQTPDDTQRQTRMAELERFAEAERETARGPPNGVDLSSLEPKPGALPQ